MKNKINSFLRYPGKFSKSLFKVIIFATVFWLSNNSVSTLNASENQDSLELITKDLDSPANMVTPRDGSKRVFVLEKNLGTIRVIKDGKLLSQVFLDIRNRLADELYNEQGLLGLAFPPEFPLKKHVYVTYTDPEGNLVLSRFQVSEDTKTAINSSEKILLVTENWVFIVSTGMHHCGHIAFGPKDKYLYLCIGDSDEHGNPKNSAQNLNFLQGKILRLDVESPQEPYSIPPDNPFITQKDARPEIWAYGLRNPWRFSFDPLTGDLLIPDVGWDFWEEINFQPASSKGGQNYGWRLAEGNECHETCDDKNLTWPIHEYPHGERGCAVIGGEVYRGQKFPQWNGTYVFSDYCSGLIWALRDVRGEPQIRLISKPTINPTAIISGPDGEFLFSDAGQGAIYRFKFPEIFDEGWKNLKKESFELMLSSRRSGMIIDTIKSDKRWILGEKIANFYNMLGRPFDWFLD